MWCMDKFRKGIPVEEFAHEPKPKKTMRGSVRAFYMIGYILTQATTGGGQKSSTANSTARNDIDTSNVPKYIYFRGSAHRSEVLHSS